MSIKKILVSGYYGFNNFGDDAILKVLIEDLKATFDSAEVTVFSNNPAQTSQDYGVRARYRFCLKTIYNEMKRTDLFVSGGGSLLQDVTSISSVIYYLFLIMLAKAFGKKVCMYAQGVGPLNKPLSRTLASMILKGLDLVIVRDSKSHELLKSLGIKSHVTADPVWGLEEEHPVTKPDKMQVGIQLRDWPDLNEATLENLAHSINDTFNAGSCTINLLSFQDNLDFAPLQKLESILREINPALEVRLHSNISIFTGVPLITGVDYIVAMRFHACLTAIKFGIPTLALSYDPKVTTLAETAQIPCIKIADMQREALTERIKDLIANEKNYKEKLESYSKTKQAEAFKNRQLMSEYLV